MAEKSKLLQLDWLIALSFFLTNLARTEWVQGPMRYVLISLILLSIGFIIGLVFTQRGFSTLSPIGIVAVAIGFVPSALWYLVRISRAVDLTDLTAGLETLYEVSNYISLSLLVILLPYLLLKQSASRRRRG